MFLRLLERWLGCKHERFSFPQTKEGVTHVCCLKCGKEFEYDWNSMQIVTSGTSKPVKQEKIEIKESQIGKAKKDTV